MTALDIEVVVVTKHGGQALTKLIGLDENGQKQVNDKACFLMQGEAECVKIHSAGDFADLIVSFNYNQAMILGTLRDWHPRCVKIVTKKAFRKLNSELRKGVATRSLDDFWYRPGKPAFVLIDFDLKGMPEAVAAKLKELGGFEKAIAMLIPGLANAIRVFRASTSAGLFNTEKEEPLPRSDGRHLYVAIIDGDDAIRFLHDLHDRAWLAGLGWHVISKSGQMLERSIVDRQVGSPERLAFEADPILQVPLVQDKDARRPIPLGEELLCTRETCPPLDQIERGTLTALKQKSIEALAPQRAKQRTMWEAERVENLVHRGVDRQHARQTVQKWGNCVLLPDVMLEFDDPEIGDVPIGEILKDPETYVGETLADPLEGVEYGRCKAILYRRDDGTLFIKSFAHGEMYYDLLLDYHAVAAEVENADTDGLEKLFIRLVLIADLDLAETERLRNIVADRTGISKTTLSKMLAQGKEKQKERRRSQTHTDGTITDADLERYAPIPLGYTKQNQFVFVLPKKQLHVVVGTSQLTKPDYLIGLAPLAYWQTHYPSGDTALRFSSFAAAGALEEACRNVGPFDPLAVRGRGIWYDDDYGIVINLGGPVPSPKYLCFEPIYIDRGAEFDAERLLRLLEKFNWRDPKDAQLLLGWLAMAPICGAVTWRPHIWIHGPPKTGKTTVHGLLKSTCSPLALSCDGGSTEAGIRQMLGADSRPVLIDEYESDQQHQKGIMRLARTASSADDPVLRGTIEGKALSFTVRATFAFFSVNPLGMSVADESRIVMFELAKHDNKDDTAAEIEREIAYFRQQRGKWCSFMVERAGLLRQAVDLYSRIITDGDRRHRQNMATLQAGAYVARFGNLPDQDTVKREVAAFAATSAMHAEEQERDDARECLDFLLSHMVRGDNTEYPMGHWIAVALADQGSGLSGLADARRIIESYDMRVVWPDQKNGVWAETGGILVKNGSAAIERIYTNSRWRDRGWMRALRKLDGAAATKPIKFDTRHGAAPHRATKIPLDYIPSAIGADEAEIRRQVQQRERRGYT